MSRSILYRLLFYANYKFHIHFMIKECSKIQYCCCMKWTDHIPHKGPVLVCGCIHHEKKRKNPRAFLGKGVTLPEASAWNLKRKYIPFVRSSLEIRSSIMVKCFIQSLK